RADHEGLVHRPAEGAGRRRHHPEVGRASVPLRREDGAEGHEEGEGPGGPARSSAGVGHHVIPDATGGRRYGMPLRGGAPVTRAKQSSLRRPTPATLHRRRRNASPHVAPSPSSRTTFAVVIRTSRPLSAFTASSQPGLLPRTSTVG